MKKYLLGALFVLGTLSYAQDNKVIVPVAGGNATANLGIEVTGKIYDTADLSLVVDIKSAASANGTGFAFTMPNMFAGEENIQTAQGDFDIYVQKTAGTPGATAVKYEFDEDLDIKLVQGGVAAATATTGTPAGTASGVTLDYSLIGGTGTGTATKTIHSGGVVVKATALKTSTVGTYSDTSVQLQVALSNQVTGTN
ncbi:hypothetical protein [Cetobacterium sp.]|uniref:hypothetical protein n=1 Tax=Cetobacterium sp. TaxID=2071632 RepID=UPI003F3BB9F4